MFVGAIIRSNVEEVFFACHVAFAAAFLLRDAAGEVLHDGPGGIGAELIAAAEIEFFHRPQQRHVAVGKEIEEVIDLPGVALGDGHDQPHIAADELILESRGLILDLLDFLDVLDAGPSRVQTIAHHFRFVFQVVHLPEQMLFLLAA